MSIKLKIKVTKNILEKSKNCNPDQIAKVGENCAIALAVRDIFPKAWIGPDEIYENFQSANIIAHLPDKAAIFIDKFDHSSPEERVNMPEMEFEVEIQDEVIDQIDIENIKKLVNHPTLELI